MRKKMRKMYHLAMLFLAVVFVGSVVDLTTFTVSAAQEDYPDNGGVSGDEVTDETKTGTISQNIIPDTDLPDNDELFAGYVEQQFYGDRGVALYGLSAREELNEQGKNLYDFLKKKIENVAAGTTTSTVFTVDSATLKSWNADTKTSSFWEQFETQKILNALLHDCPYDLYWFDKTAGISMVANRLNGQINCVTIKFKVAKAYQADDYNENAPRVNTAITGATLTAVNNANAVVAANATKSDYEKLIAYRDYICGEVSYNKDVVSSSYTEGYGDPWQLIYVFDSDEGTNVVCEGYSKAFQYLCDMTTFTDDIFCYTVSGNMSTPTSGGGHMWNVVTMEDDKNYLVDVTNSDTGTIGSGGGLFLAGTSGSISDGYTFALSKNLTFTYDSNIIEFWGEDDASILNLAGSSYVQTEKKDISGFVVNLSEDSYTYDGAEKKPAVTIENLTKGTDFKISYTNNVNAGTATVTITGRNKYTGTVNKEFTIHPKKITNPTIELSETTYEYDGSEKRPVVKMKDGSENIDSSEYIVSYSNNINVGLATVTITDREGGNYVVNGSATFTIAENTSVKKDETITTGNTTEQDDAETSGSTTEQSKEETSGNTAEQSKEETLLTDTKTKAVYKVLTSDTKKDTVAYMKPTNAKKKNVTIPATVTLNGITYKVTTIANNAFKNNKNITKVTIGSNITVIGKKAFYGCKKLKNITIKTGKLTKKNVGSKAFKGIHSRATIKVPKKKWKNYKSILKARGVSSKAKFKKI